MSEEKIRITREELQVAGSAAARAGSGPVERGADGLRRFGNIAAAVEAHPDVGGNLVMQGWFYLGLAGLAGAFVAWGVCEPWFEDGRGVNQWGNTWLFPLMLTLMCVGFAVAESIVERTAKKALVRGLVALPVGVILGFVFDFVANVVFAVGLQVAAAGGVESYRSPGFWVVRAVAWAAFGVAGGVVYGIVGRSGKKCVYGILGGVVGATLGGLLFDPIAMGLNGAEASRAVGMALFGAATGVAMGLVESALKDRWLLVTGGPLAGKQFILYKPVTVLGSEQENDIYLFKDPAVERQHAWIDVRGNQATLRAGAATFVNGQPARAQALRSGDTIQVGRYTFRYQEKQRG